MIFMIISVIIMICIIVGVSLFQKYLSTRQNKWFGLILPIFCFMISLITVLNVAKLQGQSVIVPIVTILVLYNVPTIIFLVIYFVCREKLKSKLLLDKMNIQDLE